MKNDMKRVNLMNHEFRNFGLLQRARFIRSVQKNIAFEDNSECIEDRDFVHSD